MQPDFAGGIQNAFALEQFVQPVMAPPCFRRASITVVPVKEAQRCTPVDGKCVRQSQPPADVAGSAWAASENSCVGESALYAGLKRVWRTWPKPISGMAGLDVMLPLPPAWPLCVPRQMPHNLTQQQSCNAQTGLDAIFMEAVTHPSAAEIGVSLALQLRYLFLCFYGGQIEDGCA